VFGWLNGRSGDVIPEQYNRSAGVEVPVSGRQAPGNPVASPQAAPAEFDAHAETYDGGMDNPVKALLGDSADDFVAIKLRWLLGRFPHLRFQNSSFRVLDYGCGTGTLLRLMALEGLQASLLGSDIASGMLGQVARHWPEEMPLPELYQQDGAQTFIAPGSVDLIIVSSVLHHVEPADRPAVYAELHRLLRPRGDLVAFEHNPFNPVTRYVVANTPIDRNAILLRSGKLRAGLSQMRFTDLRTSYLMFFPPRLRVLAPFENAIGWLPLGGQYAVTARRGDIGEATATPASQIVGAN